MPTSALEHVRFLFFAEIRRENIFLSGFVEQRRSIFTTMFNFRGDLDTVRFLGLVSETFLYDFLFFRYKFLVYNASVIYFNYIRPFLRDNFRKYLCSSFEQLVQTLTNISDETDYLWQAELLL